MSYSQTDLVADALFQAGHTDAYRLASHTHLSVPNAFSVSISALLEIGRDDLIRVLQGWIDDAFDPKGNKFGAILPHFDRSWFAGMLTLDDLAVIERAMALGYRAIGAKYACTACEFTFQEYGLDHRPKELL